MTALPPVVEFKNVSKLFNRNTPREFCALKELNFSIEDLPDVGEFISVLGPSGCGKSTMLNLLAGFSEVYPPTTGEILVRGVPVTGPGKDRGMVFQKYSSFPNRTVLENVAFGLMLNRRELGLSDAQISDTATRWIEKVGLIQHRDKYPHQLSGGQQQRVAIARCLAMKPRIILMDEPFSALDEPTRIEMQQLILALWKEVEATVFIVTHSIVEGVFLGDRVWLFTPAPGKIGKEFNNLPKYPSDVNPADVQRSKEFLDLVGTVSHAFHEIETAGRAQ